MTPTPTSAEQPPTKRQLAYLKTLAERMGQTFTWPNSRVAASGEIRRLQAAAPSGRGEREMERHDWDAEAAAREANCDVPIRQDEVAGFGAQCTWSGRP